jgi:hypothetical protein
MAEKDAATVLEEAADLLLIRGVCRNGTYGTPGGPRCTIGAVSEVMEVGDMAAWISPAGKAVADHLRHRGVLTLTDWNDNSDDFEVIDTLRLVAKDLRNEAG